MVLNQERCNYVTVKKLSALLRGIASKHDDYIYGLKYISSFV